MQLDQDILERMHIFFKADNIPRGNHKELFMFRGMLRPLMAHQAYGMYWMLERETLPLKQSDGTEFPSTGLTILGDIPGMGKSATVCALIYFTRALDLAHSTVDKCRKSKIAAIRAKHLPASSETFQQTEKSQCPTEPFEICCPCVERNPSAKLRPTRGVNIYLVPNNLMLNAVEEFYKQIDMEESKNYLKLEVRVQATPESGKKANIAKLQIGGVTQPTDLKTLRLEGKACQELIENGEKNWVEFSRWIFFTNSQAYKGAMVNTGVHGIPCGRWIRDEFHQEHAMDNSSMSYARDLIHRRAKVRPHRTPKIVLMSGTPIRMGIEDLLGASSLWSFCALLNSNDTLALREKYMTSTPDKWVDLTAQMSHSFWKKYTPSGLIGLRTLFSKDPDTAKPEFKTLISTIMIQRSRGAEWFDGQVLMNLPRMNYYQVTCTMKTHTNNQLMARIKGSVTPVGSERVSRSASSQIALILKKCATFPVLAQLLRPNRDPEMIQYEFGKKWMDTHNVFTTNMKSSTNPLWSNRELIWRESPKIPLIDSILAEQLPRRDFMDRPAKGILFVEYNETAYLLYHVSQFEAIPIRGDTRLTEDSTLIKNTRRRPVFM